MMKKNIKIVREEIEKEILRIESYTDVRHITNYGVIYYTGANDANIVGILGKMQKETANVTVSFLSTPSVMVTTSAKYKREWTLGREAVFSETTFLWYVLNAAEMFFEAPLLVNAILYDPLRIFDDVIENVAPISDAKYSFFNGSLDPIEKLISAHWRTRKIFKYSATSGIIESDKRIYGGECNRCRSLLARVFVIIACENYCFMCALADSIYLDSSALVKQGEKITIGRNMIKNAPCEDWLFRGKISKILGKINTISHEDKVWIHADYKECMRLFYLGLIMQKKIYI
jgi:hypothetical protein